MKHSQPMSIYNITSVVTSKANTWIMLSPRPHGNPSGKHQPERTVQRPGGNSESPNGKHWPKDSSPEMGRAGRDPLLETHEYPRRSDTGLAHRSPGDLHAGRGLSSAFPERLRPPRRTQEGRDASLPRLPASDPQERLGRSESGLVFKVRFTEV